MSNVNQQLTTPAVPDLPHPQDRYDARSFALTNAALRNFFLKVSSLFGSLIGPRGGKNINFPYGAVQRSTDFNFSASNTAYLVTCNTTDFLNGMTLDVGDGLHVVQAGKYNYQFSIQIANTDTAIQNCVVWLRKNGTDIVGTASKFDIPSKHGSSDGYLIAACNFYVDLADGDHVELWAASSSTSAYFEAYAAQTSPYARPSIPSVVVTLSFVSN
jgi:hypothetical protein